MDFHVAPKRQNSCIKTDINRKENNKAQNNKKQQCNNRVKQGKTMSSCWELKGNYKNISVKSLKIQKFPFMVE